MSTELAKNIERFIVTEENILTENEWAERIDLLYAENLERLLSKDSKPNQEKETK